MSDFAKKYPEHVKLDQVMKLHEFTQKFGEEIDFGGKYVLMVRSDGECPCCGNDKLRVSNLSEAFAEMFGIDYNELEQEKRRMLEEIRQWQ